MMFMNFIGAVHGSSPLARGTLNRQLLHTTQRRLIPARAGNTMMFMNFIGAVHGSSPLARGTRKSIAPMAATARLIPARAGNTSGHQVHAPRRPAHPRSRGEHTGACQVGGQEFGSSPLARGTLLLMVCT